MLLNPAKLSLGELFVFFLDELFFCRFTISTISIKIPLLVSNLLLLVSNDGMVLLVWWFPKYGSFLNNTKECRLTN